jgi:hypothetical protein
MIELFSVHNQFKESLSRFRDFDPYLKKIKSAPFKYVSSLIREKSLQTPGIFLISGGRQVGKSTFLKQFILHLLEQKKAVPRNILFLTGELIDSPHILKRYIDDFTHQGETQYLFIDEVNYIPDWDKAIKYCADSGMFRSTRVLLTGSDSKIIKEAMKRFAGRRGRASKTNFLFHPLSFSETVTLKHGPKDPDAIDPRQLQDYFFEYLTHGGYLPAISEYMRTGAVPDFVVTTYIEWIIGDILKHNKSEHYLYEVLSGVLKTYGTQVSWNTLGRFLSIEHHKTISDYCRILEDIHVLYVVPALDENKLTAAPKKNKKIYFCDPFIYNALNSYLFQKKTARKDIKNNPRLISLLAEGVVIDQFRRYRPVYYIKGTRGEVDAAVVVKNTFLPIEVKWARQIRPQEIKQIKHYPNGIIYGPREMDQPAENPSVYSLPRELLRVDTPELDLIKYYRNKK